MAGALCVFAWWLSLIYALGQPYGLSNRPPVGPFLDGRLPARLQAGTGQWTCEVAFTNLVFTNATGLTFLPGTDRLVVWEREGRIYSFTNSPAASQKTLVLDLSNQCQGWDDSGLGAVAFHPGFATNRYMFVWYNYVTPGTVAGGMNQRPPSFRTNWDRLSRFTLDANGVALPGSEVVFVDQQSVSVWHNGGGMFFHPENGFLYFTNGDDTDTANGQRINRSLHSGVFRIDVDQRGGSVSHPIPRQPVNGATANYYIPNDNPFVGQSGVLEEFFALGLRNPFRMTRDPVSGRIFLGDVGSSAWEEINILETNDTAGVNFQWASLEGPNNDLSGTYVGVSKRPFFAYQNPGSAAVIGGYVYRGTEHAALLGGRYIFADNISGRIYSLNATNPAGGAVALCTLTNGNGPLVGPNYAGLSSFGVDQNQELYLCQMGSLGGRIHKLRDRSVTNATLPALLSQTGVFTNLATLATHSGLVPYSVNVPFWSDGAEKQRWVAVPTNGQAGFAANGEWTFPPGSVFVKHFEIVTNLLNPSQRLRLETRLLVRDDQGGVYGATYRWRSDRSDADLVTAAVTGNYVVRTGLLQTQARSWYFPGPQDCLACHNAAAGRVLGLNTRQLNGDFTYPATGITDNQLRSWNHSGLLSLGVGEGAITNLPRLPSITNAAVDLASRARAYLDANCSACHRPGGAPAFWDARSETSPELQGIWDGPVANNLGLTNARVVAPGSLANSVLYQRMLATNTLRMPPVGRLVADTEGINLIALWITNAGPSVNLTAPATGTVLTQPWTLSLNAAAADADGVRRVEFYAGTNRLAERTNSPYTWIWTNAPPGQYSLVARAADAYGTVSTSSPVLLSIQPLRLKPPLWQGGATNGARLTFPAESGQSYTIEASSNLLTWSVVRVLTATNGLIDWRDTNTAFPHRFFRARPGP